MSIPQEQREIIGQMQSLKAHRLGQQHLFNMVLADIVKRRDKNKLRSRSMKKTDQQREYFGAKTEALNEVIEFMNALPISRDD